MLLDQGENRAVCLRYCFAQKALRSAKQFLTRWTNPSNATVLD
jgi:hypothetical protein